MKKYGSADFRVKNIVLNRDILIFISNFTVDKPLFECCGIVTRIKEIRSFLNRYLPAQKPVLIDCKSINYPILYVLLREFLISY